MGGSTDEDREETDNDDVEAVHTFVVHYCCALTRDPMSVNYKPHPLWPTNAGGGVVDERHEHRH